MLALTDRIREAAENDRAAKARDLWSRGSTRANVTSSIRVVLKRMAAGRERCMYCGDS